MNRPIKILIVVSVLLNFLLAGVFIIHLSHHAFGGHRSDNIAAQLPTDKRKMYEESMATMDRQAESLRNALKDARKDSVRVLTAPNFDKDAYIEAIKKIVYLRSQMSELTAMTIMNLAEKFSAEERVILSEALGERWLNRSSSPDKKEERDPGVHIKSF